MEQVLRQFVENEVMRESIKAHFINTLEKKIIEKAYAGHDVQDIAEAKKVIDKSFSELIAMFNETQPIQRNPR